MRILVPFVFWVFILWKVDAATDENGAKKAHQEALQSKGKVKQLPKNPDQQKGTSPLQSASVFQTSEAPQFQNFDAARTEQQIVKSEEKPRLVPISYEFAYGTPSHSHIQNKHPSGIIEGRYVIHAPNGQHRTVEYIADKGGFRAGVSTNEPGTETGFSGGSAIVSTAINSVSSGIQTPREQPAALKIVDIQPFPGPLVRYEVVPRDSSQQVQSPQLPLPQLQSNLLPPQSAPDLSPPAPSSQVLRSQQLSHVLNQQPPSYASRSTTHRVESAVQILPPPIFATPVMHSMSGGAPTVGEVQQMRVLDPTIPPSGHFLIPQSQLQVLPPTGFHVMGHGTAAHSGGPQTQDFPNARVPQHIPNKLDIVPDIRVEVVNNAPRAVVHAPRPNPVRNPAANVVAVQNAIDIAPPPPVAPPAPGMAFEHLHHSDHLEHVKLTGPRTNGVPAPVEPVSKPQEIARETQLYPIVKRPMSGERPGQFHSIQPTNDAHIFEVKTKIIEHGNIQNNEIPRQFPRNLLFEAPILAAVKVADFGASRDKIQYPEAFSKNLPSPSQHPPAMTVKQSDPLIFFAITPSAQIPRVHPMVKPSELSKTFDSIDAPTVHVAGMSKFFDDIKKHHMNEVNLVKKHEYQFQAVASTITPFLLKQRINQDRFRHYNMF